jgi:FkbM family methyltransferase
MKILPMFYKALFLVTIYLPLWTRDCLLTFLAILLGRDRAIDILTRLFKSRGLIGILPDRSLLFYPLDDLKLLSIISEIYSKKIYDTKQMESFRYVCDVGAHIGLFTLRVSKKAQNSKVIAIEPNPVNYKFLLRNIAINGLSDKVYALNVAVGKERKRTVLYLSKISRGDSSLKRWHDAGANGNLIVNVLPLDNILFNSKTYDLIKIDVEGAETEVLRGLEKQYTKVNRIIVEVHVSIVNVNEIHKWIHNHGFVVTKTKKLYEDCLLLEAQRPCA